jgi:hypothetical protein
MVHACGARQTKRPLPDAAVIAGASATDRRASTLVPAALLGAWFGLRIFRLSYRRFELTVNMLLILSGVGLIL